MDTNQKNAILKFVYIPLTATKPVIEKLKKGKLMQF